jgi:hypothetical protein
MRTRSSHPALYEKMRRQASSSISPTTGLELVDSVQARDPADSWLSAGRAVRVPVGYVLLGIGLAILLLVGAFMLGHRQGRAVARAEFEQTYLNGAAPGGSALSSLDPLVESNAADDPLGIAGATNDSPSSVQTGKPPSSWGPVVPKSDPRKKGLSYFVLATTKPEGAARLANFCRARGLETYVLPSDNPNDRKHGHSWVVAFPGFPLTAKGSPSIQALEEQIRAIGRQWKASERGARDLSDFFTATYD